MNHRQSKNNGDEKRCLPENCYKGYLNEINREENFCLTSRYHELFY